MGCACSTPPPQVEGGCEWDQSGGHELEKPLRSGWIKLLDARWLVELAESGGVLQRQQDLPPEAFVHWHDLRAAGAGTDGHRSWLRVVVLSHPWLQPDHPDPYGENLRLIAKVIRIYLENYRNRGRPYGVLIDFTALPQEPRSAEDEEVFTRALPTLNLFYSHPRTVVWKSTRFPAGYPDSSPFQYDLPEGANSVDYAERGWCCAESAMSGLVKGSGKVLDLGKLPAGATSLYELLSGCKDKREPPWHPEVFREELDKKTFSSKVADFDNVARLYSDAFMRRLGTSKELNFSGLGWNAAEASKLVRALSAIESLEILNLSGNELGDAGALLLGDALRTNACIKKVALHGNQIGDAGARGLGEGLRTNSVLLHLSLCENQVGDEGACYLGQALALNASLRKLKLHGNCVGNRGTQGLGQALFSNAALRELDLNDNQVGDEGACGLSCALNVNAALTELCLDGNHVGDEGARGLSSALSLNATLTALGLSYNAVGAEGVRGFGQALSSNSTLVELGLDGNQVGDEGAVGLGQGLSTNTALKTLWLQNDNVGDEGARGLGQALLANSRLEDLYIRANNVGRDGRKALEEAAAARTRLGGKRLSVRF